MNAWADELASAATRAELGIAVDVRQSIYLELVRLLIFLRVYELKIYQSPLSGHTEKD